MLCAKARGARSPMTSTPPFDIALPEEASMKEMIDALWYLPRDLVSDGFDAALGALGRSGSRETVGDARATRR